MIQTANDLIKSALKGAGVLGIGQVASAEDMNDALDQLNLVIDDWTTRRYLIYHLVDTVFTSTGAESYTVGTGQNFNVERPDKLEGAFFRQYPTAGGIPVDYALDIYYARQDYNRIKLKTMGTWPSVCFYDAAYPTGLLYVWPIPAAAIYDIHITTKEVISEITNPTQPINLPRVYRNALFWNLVVSLRELYQMEPTPTSVAKAKGALATLRQANIQVPRAQIDATLLRGGSIYNIYSDDQ